MSVAELGKDACTSMEVALSSVVGQAGSAKMSVEEAKARLRALAAGLKVDISKVAVLWSMEADVSPLSAAPLLQSLQNDITGLCGTLCSLRSAGATLKGSLVTIAKDIVETCKHFVQALCMQGLRGKMIIPLAAKAIYYCDVAAATPLSNRSAIGRSITKVAASVRDVLREVGELLAQPGARGGQEASGNEEPGSVAGSNPDFELDGLSAAEHAVASTGQDLLKQAEALLQLVVKVLSTSGEPAPGSQLDAWEAVALHCRAVGSAAVDLGAALYAPQDADEVAWSAQRIVSSSVQITRAMPEECKQVVPGQLQWCVQQAMDADRNLVNMIETLQLERAHQKLPEE